MQFHERSALLILLPLLGRPLFRARNRDAAFFRDGAHRLRKRDLVHLHHEFKNVAARAASEAVVNLLHRMHRKRRRLFGMKRTKPREILPGLFQAYVFAHHADNVRLLLHAIRK